MTIRRLIILGAGRPRDHGLQSSLRSFGSARQTVLEWQLEAFRDVANEVEFIGGHDLDRIIARFPDLTYRVNEHWQETGAVSSLRCALYPHEEAVTLFVSYGDILLRSSLVDELAEEDEEKMAIAVAGGAPALQSLPDGRLPESLRAGGKDFEFIGLIRVPESLYTEFRKFVIVQSERIGDLGLAALIESWIEQRGHDTTRLVMAGRNWAHLEDYRSVARFILGTKAETLMRLRGRLRCASILPMILVHRARWADDPESIVREIIAKFPDTALAVRSSAVDEDTFGESNAGRYLSRLNVPPRPSYLHDAIDAVFQSYKDSPYDQVLVQPMLDGVVESGVVFTRQLGTGAPYYTIQYAFGDDTTVITGGKSGRSITWFVSRFASNVVTKSLPHRLLRVLEAVREIEQLLSYDELDIEFAVRNDGAVYILQVRPLYLSGYPPIQDLDQQVQGTVGCIEMALVELNKPQPGLVGDYSIWSVMSDWNPAEIIGSRPSPLAFDLYRMIVTDSIWARARSESGYRNIPNWPLVRCFAGQPYVDVRASLNSFIPKAVSDDVARRIVNHALHKLREHPELHDKLEFSVIPTCADFRLEEWMSCIRRDTELTVEDAAVYAKALSSITKYIIEKTPSYLTEVERLDKELDKGMPRKGLLSDHVRLLLETCRDRGALLFAHLARAGFVASAFLESAVLKDLLDKNRVEQLRASIETVGTALARDAWRVKTGALSREAFISRYGHLRPGTYDITSPSYAARPDLFIDPLIEAADEPQQCEFSFTTEEAQVIEQELGKLNLELTADSFLNFIRCAVYGREYGKFVFTRLLSEAINLMSEELSELRIEPELHEFVSLGQVLEASSYIWGGELREDAMRRQAETSRERQFVTSRVLLPPLISSAEDLFFFNLPDVVPNFIGERQIQGELIVLSERKFDGAVVRGKIVVIESADPGYDFLFSLGILGLITAYGGPNSHMAIRAAEFGLPAVIGVGSETYKLLRTGDRVEIDGRRQLLRSVNRDWVVCG